MNRSILVALVLSTAALSACAAPSLDGSETPGTEATQRDTTALTRPATRGEVGQLLQIPGQAPRDGGYTVRVASLRVFGVSLGDGVLGPSAVVADTSTWQTTELHEGQALGHSLRVGSITPQGVELQATSGAPRVSLLPVLKTTRVEIVEHPWDAPARYVGKNRFTVDRAALEAWAGADLGATATARRVFGQEGVILSDVKSDGFVGALGFHDGDILFSVDGATMAGGDLTRVKDALLRAPSGGAVRVRYHRGQASQDAVFDKN